MVAGAFADEGPTVVAILGRVRAVRVSALYFKYGN